MTKPMYQCAMCGKMVAGRSLCKHCEKMLHHQLKKSASMPGGVHRMEMTK